MSMSSQRRNPERAVQKAIARWLCAYGCLIAITDAGAAYKAGAFFGRALPPGWPDITGLLPDGRFIGVECKSKRGRQSPVQKFMEQEIRKRNGIYVLAHSVQDVEKVLEKLKPCRTEQTDS